MTDARWSEIAADAAAEGHWGGDWHADLIWRVIDPPAGQAR
jgi:hypothetical protein